jgi:hypothetical protein
MPFSLFNNALGTTTYTQAKTNASNTVAQAQATAAQPAGAAPPNATAANKINASFTGLCQALNDFQKSLVDQGTYAVADSYEIEFAPAALAQSKIKKPGNTDFSSTPTQQPTANGQQLNPKTNSVNTTGRSYPVVAGTQIVQFIDKVMRNSSYMDDQLLYYKDEVTGKTVPTANSANGGVGWFKISVTTTQKGWDYKRKDFAYNMKFTISIYGINQMQSEYFPKGRYKGAHKIYNYWFTGQNNSVLDFNQDYNNLYRVVVSGENVNYLKNATSDPRNLTKYTFAAASGQSDQGAAKGANEPVANAADYLYSPSDQAKARIRIVGDPAWLQQGEVTQGVSAKNFNFAPFNADGTINYDSQEVVFIIAWNRPVDYNFNTGIAEVNANNVSGTNTVGQAAASLPQESYAYTAISVKHTFSKGRFEQEIEGRLLVENYSDLQNAVLPAPSKPSQATGSAQVPDTTNLVQAQPQNPNDTAKNNTVRQANTSLSPNTDGAPSNYTTPTANPPSSVSPPLSDSQPVPTPPAQPATSNGEIVSSNTAPPPTAGTLTYQQQIQNVARAEQGLPPLVSAPPPGSVTSNGAIVSTQTLQDQIQNVVNAQLPGVNRTPQLENRET